MGKKILIIGRSGSGKSTLADILCDKFNLKSVESYTTRPMRVENETGHIFITEEEAKTFTDKVAETVIDGYEYFAIRQQVAECNIYVIDPNGLLMLTKRMPEGNFYAVYLTADNEKRKKVAIDRADDKAKEEKRYASRIADEDKQFSQFEAWLDGVTTTDNPFVNIGDNVTVEIYTNPLNNLQALEDIADDIMRGVK